MHLSTLNTIQRHVYAVQPRQHSDQQSQDQSHRDQAEDAAILELEHRGEDESKDGSPLMQLAYGPATQRPAPRMLSSVERPSENPLHVLSVYGGTRKSAPSGARFDAYS